MHTASTPMRPGKPAAPRQAGTVMAYADAFDLPVQEQIDYVKRGLPAQGVPQVAADLHLSTDRYISILGLPKSTLARKIKENQRLPVEQSERVFQTMRLVGLVQQLVKDYGDAQGFDAAQWLGQWIEQPNPALGGNCPAGYLDTATGAALVESLLHAMVSGAYA